MRPFLLSLSFLLAISTLSAQITANCGGSEPKVLLAGDSWAQYMGDDGVHNSLFDQYGQADKYLVTQTLGFAPGPGYNGPEYAISGSLASEWANTADYPYIQNMVAALQLNTSIEWVVLSIGGNDVLAGKSEGGWYKDMDLDVAGSEAALFATIGANTQAVIDAALAVRPDIKVLISSYEYPNFDVEFGTCWIYACDKREDLSRDPNNDLITNAEINQMMLLSESYRHPMAINNLRVFYDNSIGLMHYIYGSANANEGTLAQPQANSPYMAGGDPALPTLRSNFRIWGDPIHLDAAAYDYKVKNQMDNHLFQTLRNVPDATYFSEGGSSDGWVDIIDDEFGSNGIRMGDNGGSTDWRGILSFNTADLPDNAQVTGASIYLHRSGEGFGSNPFSLNDRSPHVDIKNGFFGNTNNVELIDGTAAASATDVGCFHGAVDEDYHVTRIDIDPVFLQHFNVNGPTQFRIYFDNADFIPNYVHYFDGSQNGLTSNGEERFAPADPQLIYEDQIVTRVADDGSVFEEMRSVAAVAHNGLSKFMGTAAPFLDISYELVLPVELTAFTATLQDKSVLLNWESNQEEGFLGFQLQKSADGQRWEDLAFIPGQSESGEEQAYNYLDQQPFNGDNYYRLAMQDIDGSLSYSSIKKVWVSRTSAGVTVSPNPFKTQLQLLFPESLQQPLTIQLVDLLGRPVQSWQYELVESPTLQLNLQKDLPPGPYWLRLQLREEVQTIKVLRQ